MSLVLVGNVYQTPLSFDVLWNHPRLRFGAALAKCRSMNTKKNRRLALQFIARAKRTENNLDVRSRVNAMWRKHGNLEPVLAFLSKR